MLSRFGIHYLRLGQELWHPYVSSLHQFGIFQTIFCKYMIK